MIENASLFDINGNLFPKVSCGKGDSKVVIIKGCTEGNVGSVVSREVEGGMKVNHIVLVRDKCK